MADELVQQIWDSELNWSWIYHSFDSGGATEARTGAGAATGAAATGGGGGGGGG